MREALSPLRLTFEGKGWPSDSQLLLLKACLSKGHEAVESWEQWRKREPLDYIEAGSVRLLPMLHYNLKKAGVTDPIMGRYSGVHRITWYRNQRLFRRVAEVISDLESAGIPTVLLKGAALAHAYYPDSGRRPMIDGDILVPEGREMDAINRLLEQGWIPGEGFDRSRIKIQLPTCHAFYVLNHEGVGLDVHWRISPRDSTWRLTREARSSLPKIRVHGVKVPTLPRSGQLLHACIHGVPWNPTASLRWVVDSILILEADKAEPVDWEWLVSRARERNLTAMLAHGLEYLRRHFSAPVPPTVMESLLTTPIPRWEIDEFRMLQRSGPIQSRIDGLWHSYQRLRHTTNDWNQKAWRAYPEYLRIRWGLEHQRQIPIEAIKKAPRVLRQCLWP